MSETKKSGILPTELLDIITKPMSSKDLREKLGVKNLSNITRYLEDEGKLLRIAFKRGRRGGIKYGSHELLGNLANELYFYKPGQEEAVIDLLIKNLPPREEMNNGMKKSLTYLLNQSLPKKIFKRVQIYYLKAYDILKIMASQSRPLSRKEIASSFGHKSWDWYFEENLKLLEEEGMISRVGSAYSPTPLGLNFLEKCEERTPIVTNCFFIRVKK